MPGMASTAVQSEQQTLTVTQLTAQIKGVVEGAFPSVWVTGEISNFSRPQSGHCYLTLKDDAAQIRAVVWRSTAAKIKFDLTDGLEVLCRGHLDVYAPRGSYQLVIDQVQPKGVGPLELALRKLREKLAKEGLFDPQRKQRLPAFPRRIAFVTSPTGAAIHDFLEVLRRRWRGVEVLVIPARVQGTGATQEIVAGIHAANRLKPPPDVLIVGRGGGSLEDLWSFNEEPVVRAIAESKIPTISAVGHEIDVTLADLAADVRALTPSEAAERAVPDADDLLGHLRNQRQRLLNGVRQKVIAAQARVDAVAAQRSFRRPYDRVHDLSRRVDELSARARRAADSYRAECRNRLATLVGKLESLSPLAVLERGYSITQDTGNESIVRSAADLHTGQELLTRLADGEVTSVITRISEKA